MNRVYWCVEIGKRLQLFNNFIFWLLLGRWFNVFRRFSCWGDESRRFSLLTASIHWLNGCHWGHPHHRLGRHRRHKRRIHQLLSIKRLLLLNRWWGHKVSHWLLLIVKWLLLHHLLLLVISVTSRRHHHLLVRVAGSHHRLLLLLLSIGNRIQTTAILMIIWVNRVITWIGLFFCCPPPPQQTAIDVKMRSTRFVMKAKMLIAINVHSMAR